MRQRGLTHGVLAAAAAAVVALAGCSGRDVAGLDPAPLNTDPVVFDDDFGEAVDYQAFAGSKFDAVEMDGTEVYEGTASLKVTVPGPGAVDGTFAGGAFTTYGARDLTGYDALTFYAKSSVNSTMDIVGLGNDNTGTSLYEANRTAIPLTTDWARVILPIPEPSKLTDERGLFYFAEGHENNQGFFVWFDEIKFEKTGAISNPRPYMATETIDTFVGAEVIPNDTRVTFDVDRDEVVVGHHPAYFTYFSSDESVATSTGGRIAAVGGGTATITAKLDTVDVEGVVTLNVVGPPGDPAPAPTHPSGDVISLFSDVYDDVTVDTWHANWEWSTGTVSDFVIDGDNVKVYTDLNFAGIEFVSETIDATTPGMTHFHMDVWAPEGSEFKIKLVDFGEDGTWGGAPDSEGELTFNAASTPAFVAGSWCALDVPLADFGLVATEHLAQLVISSGNVSTVFVDNVYFRK